MAFNVFVQNTNGQPIANQPVTVTFISGRQDTKVTGMADSVAYAAFPVWVEDIGEVRATTVYNGESFEALGEVTESGTGEATIIVSAASTITFNVKAVGNGTVAPSGTLQLTIDKIYAFTAIGAGFDHWELSIPNPDIYKQNPVRIMMIAAYDDASLTAVFKPINYLGLGVVILGVIALVGIAYYNHRI